MKYPGKRVVATRLEVLLDVTLRPLGALVRVATGASIRCPDGCGQYGTREPKAVVRAIVDQHVGALRHMAVRAKAAGRSGLVKVVFWSIEGIGFVAAGAQRVALRLEIRAVPVVAIAAHHARRVHLALQERAIDIDLVLDLAVVEVERLIEHREAVAVVIARPIPA